MRGEGGGPYEVDSTYMQGSSIPRPSEAYQTNMMMEPSSPPPPWQFHSALPKQEPMDHENRSDSGIHSGSDFHSSSPGSDHSENIPQSSRSISLMIPPIHQPKYCPIPTVGINQPSAMIQQHNYNDHIPLLTPPCSEPMTSPKDQDNQTRANADNEAKSEDMDFQPSLIPCASSDVAGPSRSRSSTYSIHTNPLRSLQMAFERNTLTSTRANTDNGVKSGDIDFQSSLTTCASPDVAGPSHSRSSTYTTLTDPLRSLEIALKQNRNLASPPVSPKTSEYSGEDENKSDNDGDEYDDRELRVPKVNSHGKVKKFKCKQCDFVAITKLAYWSHIRTHIKPDKLLTCPQCPFVTEYKHHLEYHLRNHFGSKPFKCDQCNYTCVNKSMLNSHLKSHSTVYQYRCADCTYITKYCHSLKVHLRKYEHKPAMVLNPDGTPNPVPIIDVYGTRRGPKLKTQEQRVVQENNPEQALPYPLSQLMFNTPQLQLPFSRLPFFPGFSAPMPSPLLLHNLEQIANGQTGFFPPQENAGEASGTSQAEPEVLDLSKPEQPVLKNRRKGRAYKRAPTQDTSSDDEEETTMFSNVEVVQEAEEQMQKDETVDQKEEEDVSNNNNKDDFPCHYCNIKFGDPVLHTMHMGYHGFNNPFTCNMCGAECGDKFSFFVHIATSPHS